MLDKVNLIKVILNKELESRDLDDEVIIKISQKLDSLIVEHYNSIIGDKANRNEMQDETF
jgi:hypothetical protein